MKKKETFAVVVELEWDSHKEDPRGALAATFSAIADGIANGQTKGPLPNDGSWKVRDGVALLQRRPG